MQFLQIVNGGDIRVVESGEHACFPLQPLDAVRMTGKGLGQDLDGAFAVELVVERPVDLAHAALPERRPNFVRPQHFAGGKQRVSRWVLQQAASAFPGRTVKTAVVRLACIQE